MSAEGVRELRRVWSDAIRPDPVYTIDEWADRERYLPPSTSAEPGRWRTSRTPYLREPMRALSPGTPIEQVTLVFGAQLGKTEVLLNYVGHGIAASPSPMLLVQPTVDTAEKFSKMRLQPMIEASPTIAALISDRSRDSSSTLTLKEFPGGVLRLAGANAPSGLASQPVRRLALDEVDRYPLDTGEGDPVELARKRTSTFGASRKILAVSTPTDEGVSRIWQLYEEGDQRRFWVPCPLCGAEQVLVWSQVRFDREDPQGAWYECEHCGERIDERHKGAMLKHGIWRPTNPNAPAHVRSYHLSALYSPLGWLSWGDIAEAFLKARGNPERLRVWTNTNLAELWTVQGGQTLSASTLQDAASPQSFRERLPASVSLLTAGVDVQDDRLELEIVGWADGEESWSVDYITITGDTEAAKTWDELEHVLLRTYPHPELGELRVQAAAIDSGGHRTQRVYDFCRTHKARRWWAVKGANEAPGNRRPVWPQRPSRKKGRAPLYIVGTNAAKEVIYGRLRLEGNGPGCCHFPAERPAEWFAQLTAERYEERRIKGRRVLVWHLPSGRRNEALDCRVYAYAALEGFKQLGGGIGRARAYARRELARAASSPATVAPGQPARQPANRVKRRDRAPRGNPFGSLWGK